MTKFAANLTMLFQEKPFLERFAAARQAGFDAVEYMFPSAVLLDPKETEHDARCPGHAANPPATPDPV
ncbi:hypothetical protein [Deinococcus aluminii]|uniref:Hydroxypyruvate isomerase n=1 Tax=Deinococcus aluminii TaxID=1656885 RepID=A0ABP9XG26_9DEIO